MKLKISQKELIKHINIAQKAVSSRTTIQILEGILFIAEENCLRLVATDLELIVDTKANCEIYEKGQIVINSSMIGNIIRKLPDDDIYIEVDDNNINIKCLSTEFNIQGQDSNEFPSLPYIDKDVKLTLEQSELKDSIRKTSFATSMDQTRPDLTGVLFNIMNDRIEFVALDGYRVSLNCMSNVSDFEMKAIVPARALNEVYKILEEGEITVNIITGNIIFKLENTDVYSRLIDGQYIDYNQVMKQDFSTVVTIEKRALQMALERASLMAKEDKANLVKLDFSGNELHISSNTDIGKVDEYVRCEIGGEDLKIAFNAKYLLDGLKVIDDDDITLNMSGSLRPMVFKPLNDSNYTYLVLPVKLAGGNND